MFDEEKKVLHLISYPKLIPLCGSDWEYGRLAGDFEYGKLSEDFIKCPTCEKLFLEQTERNRLNEQNDSHKKVVLSR